jgi:hypothetical protein
VHGADPKDGYWIQAVEVDGDGDRARDSREIIQFGLPTRVAAE